MVSPSTCHPSLAVEEQQAQNVSDEYYESNDEDMGSLAGTLEKNKKTLETIATATQVKPKAPKKINGGVKSKKRKTVDEEDGSVTGSSPSAMKSDDDGEGSLGESFRCDSTKSKLILTDVCKVCYRQHMYFKRHEIFEDVANKLITFSFLHRQPIEESP